MTNFVGRTLGPYKLETALGKGGMATVYRAFQSTVKRYVAVKVMSPEIAGVPGFVERFTREAEVIASLQHPHILPVIDYGEAEGLHYLVMRYIENGSLEDRIHKAPLSLEETARFLDQIASALDYAHKRGVVHRDFKPNNVLLDAEENCYLTDFGIARLMQSVESQNLTATGTVMGTPSYMSPEQGTGRPVDGRSDIYSLGVVLYEMVTGRLPFIADTSAALLFQHVYETPPPPQQFKPNLPDAVTAVILRTIAKNPDHRYQSASEVSRAFSEAIGRRIATPPKGTEPLNTFVGGPLNSAPVRPPTPPASRPATPMSSDLDGRTLPPGTPLPLMGTGGVPPTTPPRTPTGAMPASQPLRSPTESLDNASPSTQMTAPAARKGGVPVALIAIGAVLLFVVIAAGSAFAVISKNNQDATNVANAAGTRVAIVALSATVTPSNTFTPTNTPTFTPLPSATNTPTPTFTSTPTFTPSITFTPTITSTLTPNPTETAFAIKMATINAFGTFSANQALTQTAVENAAATAHVNQTATGIAASTQTAAASLTAIAHGTATGIAAVTNTAGANLSIAANGTRTALTATARALIAASATQTLRAPASATATPPPASPAPEAIMSGLQDDGILASVTGSLAYQQSEGATVDLKPDQPSFYRWRSISTGDIADFVFAADVTWDSLHTGDQCGMIFRYSGEQATQKFYISTIGFNGHYRILTFMNDTDTLNFDKTSSAIQTSPSAVNHLLLIGQGNAFRLYVNSKLAGSFTLNKFDKGTFAPLASTGSTAGLTCHFQNMWVWDLGGSSGPDPVTGLTAADPDTILSTLVQIGEVTEGNATLSFTDKRRVLTETQGNAFNSAILTSRIYQNFALSTDVTWDTTFETSACGIYYNGASPSDNWAALFFLRDTTYSLYVRKAAKWGTKAVVTGKSNLIKTATGDTNRVTLISINGKLNVYFNGQFAFTATDTTLKSGGLGYYIQKHETDNTTDENCRYTNTYVWTLK